ncbi:MAG TPA: EipA family protein [Rhizomicrobium sp.]|nr:EipA family protein [Rhizomicrobium sp.]
MDRKKFISGLVALGATPAVTGSLLSILPAHAADPQQNDNAQAKARATDLKYTADEITEAGANFFGITTEAMAKGVEHVFGDLGRPDAYIKGDEGSGAFVVGVRYGSGWLIRKTREPKQVYWRGPSVGFDVGGNASKCFTLVYNLREDERLIQRFPGVEGSFYLVAGLGINYQRSGGITLAPMRTGVGLRAGVNAHYQVYSNRRDWFPL